MVDQPKLTPPPDADPPRSITPDTVRRDLTSIEARLDALETDRGQSRISLKILDELAKWPEFAGSILREEEKP